MKKLFTISSSNVQYKVAMASREQVAHLLRRTGFGIRRGQIEALVSSDIHDLIDDRLADEGWALSAEEAEARNFDDIEWNTLAQEWLDRMLSPEAALHERMVWFWHGHFTSSMDKATDRLMLRQYHLLRRNALGNFADLARELIVDGAMLQYLDGDGSRGDAPNENLSREFLELFMLGRNSGYSEADVRASARILSGWRVDYESGDVTFDAEIHYDRPVSFLGTRKRWNVDSYIEAVLNQESCADHVAGKLHEHFVSTPLSDERRQELGDVLRDDNWEIRPLLSEILHSDDFVEARGRRARQPVEWLVAAATATGIERVGEQGLEYWQIGATGQVPFHPPNVAGWPDDDRWSSATQVMVRGNSILNWELSNSVINTVAPTPSAVLSHLGVTEVSQSTADALDRAIDAQTEYDRGLEVLLATAMLSPEFGTI